MSRVVQFMRDLVDKGMSWEDAALFAERFEESMDDAMAQAVAAKPKSSSAERQARYRERKRNGDVTDVTQRETQQGDVTEPAKDAPAPVHTRGENNLSRLVDTSSAVAVVAEAREPISDWPDGDANQHAKLLAQMAGTSRLDPARQPGLATTAGRLAAWRRDGASWTYDVVPAVTIMSQKRGPPIATWKYFDPAIAQSIADNRRALDIPQANGPRHERPHSSAKLDAKQANMERALRGAEMAIARRAV